MKPVAALPPAVVKLIQRVDHLSLRERVLVFAVGVALVWVAWQSLLMDPLTVRSRHVSTELIAMRERAQASELLAAQGASDPQVIAASRLHALEQRRAMLDAELAEAAHGYVSPARMAEVLRTVLDGSRGLKLVSMRNLPVETLEESDGTRPPAGAVAGAAAAGTAPAATLEQGPYVHPLEIVVQGDYASVIAYLHALEQLPWRMYWRRLDLTATGYPTNRVRLVIGTLSLSRDWMSV